MVESVGKRQAGKGYSNKATEGLGLIPALLYSGGSRFESGLSVLSTIMEGMCGLFG